MIRQFGPETGLMLIDVQKGVNVLNHWGGPNGRRNNPDCDDNIAQLIAAFRGRDKPLFYTQHDSREAASPLKLSLPTGDWLDGLEPAKGDVVVRKDVNSAFVGTDMELRLRQHGISRLVICGYFTNFCVETSTRMAGNMGYDTYLAHDACATTNRVGPDGTDYDPDLVHAMSIASLHGEFCTAITTEQAVALTKADAPDLERVQGNE